MKRTYITTISLQGNLDKAFYQPYDFFLKTNGETRFPIIPVIADTYRSGDEVQIIAVKMGMHDDVVNNYSRFLEELSELGISENQIRTIDIPVVSSDKMGVAMFKQLIRLIPDGSCVNADITYGTKPISVLLFTALNEVEKLKNVEVEGIFYGEIPWEKNKKVLTRAMLYNLTPLKNLTDVIDQLANDRPRPANIFISYRRESADAFAFLLYDRLTKDRYSVFLDVKGLHSGEFPPVFETKIQECTDFLLLLSKHSLDRCADPKDFVRMEIECAMRHGKNIIPILTYRDFTFPDSLPESLMPLRDRVNWFEMDGMGEFDQRLINLEKNYLHSRSLSGR